MNLFYGGGNWKMWQKTRGVGEQKNLCWPCSVAKWKGRERRRPFRAGMVSEISRSTLPCHHPDGNANLGPHDAHTSLSYSEKYSLGKMVA